MKIKSLTKLAMSGVALAAVAATLGTSTYAWYVTNSTATATNIQAKTISSDGSNLLLSKDGSNFQSKIVYDTATDTTGYDQLGQASNGDPLMDPVTIDGTAFTGDFITYDTESGESTAATSFLHFHLWVKSSKAATVQPVLSVVNNTIDSLPAQRAYYSIGGSGITAGQTFTVDAVRALRTSVTTTTESGTEVTSTASVAYSSANTKVYETEKIAKQADFATAYAPGGSVTSVSEGSATIVTASGDASTYTQTGAHAYFAAVMAKAPAKVAETVAPSSASAIDTVTLTAETAVRMDFFVWLEGTDTFCFDACGGQSFTFGLQFTKTGNN